MDTRKYTSETTAYLKKSFDPISDKQTTILILGTMPGDKSLELNEYYGHPQNKFWKVISAITKQQLPVTYSDKISLLLTSRIGLWDIAHKAIRKGSLDSAIKEEEPNDIETFISTHKNLNVIGFNGLKSEVLYQKYFTQKEGIRYVTLPSTSPANAGIDFETMCKRWGEILT